MKTKRANDWLQFSEKVLKQIELNYVPVYGDKGSDIASEYSVHELLSHAKIRIMRFGKNSTQEQDWLDLLKAAHFIQIAYEKNTNEK